MHVIQNKSTTMRNVDESVKNQSINYPCNFGDKAYLVCKCSCHINI